MLHMTCRFCPGMTEFVLLLAIQHVINRLHTDSDHNVSSSHIQSTVTEDTECLGHSVSRVFSLTEAKLMTGRQDQVREGPTLELVVHQAPADVVEEDADWVPSASATDLSTAATRDLLDNSLSASIN